MSMTRPSDEALAALLAFYAEAGVDCALDEEARPFLAASPGPGEVPGAGPERTGPARPAPVRSVPASGAFVPAPRAQPAPPARTSGALADAAAQTPEEAALRARDLAAAAGSLAELEAAMRAFEGCALKATARQLCFADGHPAARVMLVGEAPGAEEDATGRPFVGRSGQLLDRMLAAIGLGRARDVYIANVVPWRPPGNRTPTPQEIAICLPFIHRQIALVGPDLLVTLGAPAAQALLGVKGIVAERGKWRSALIEGREIRALPTFHPAYVLRQPLQKRAVWRDLLALRQALAALPPR
jgi:DNA polymerase